MSQAAARILEHEPPDFIPEHELVWSDGEPLDSAWERQQINLLVHVARRLMADRRRDDCYVGGDMFVYYSTEQARAVVQEVHQQLSLFESAPSTSSSEAPRKIHFRGPDFFAVVGGVEKRQRRLWASWLEGGRLPDFIFEFQSPSTAHVDARKKRELYARDLQCPEYFYYGEDDPDVPRRYRDELVGLSLSLAGTYELIEPDSRGFVWSETLGAYVGRWDGSYEGDENRWIRLYDAQGRLIPTGEEAERQQAKAERRQKEAAQAEVIRLRKLLESK